MMQAMLPWALAALLLGSVALVLLVIAIRRQRMAPFWWAALLLVGAVVCGGMLLLRGGRHAWDAVQESMRPRTGAEIYAALFGAPACAVTVEAQRDQVVPKLDSGIHLRVHACKEEVGRVLAAHPYAMDRMILQGGARAGRPDPFDPYLLGDTVLRFGHELIAGRQWRTLYVSTDSTRMIVEDVLD